MDTALEARLTRMEQEIAELRRENQSLRAVVPEPKQDAKEGEVLPRRALLTGAAYTLGAVGLSLMGTRRAEATQGYMIYGSASNNSDAQYTWLRSSSSSGTLTVISDLANDSGVALSAVGVSGHALRAYVSGNNAMGDAVNAQNQGKGHAVHAIKSVATGHCVLGIHDSKTSFYAAVAGVTKGAGPGLYGRGEGSGNAVFGQIADATKTQSAVLGTTEGAGSAIEGISLLGRGGVFKGRKAPIRLMPSSTTTKPATGSRGELFVDSTGRLWYCKTGGSATGWRQLA